MRSRGTAWAVGKREGGTDKRGVGFPIASPELLQSAKVVSNGGGGGVPTAKNNEPPGSSFVLTGDWRLSYPHGLTGRWAASTRCCGARVGRAATPCGVMRSSLWKICRERYRAKASCVGVGPHASKA